MGRSSGSRVSAGALAGALAAVAWAVLAGPASAAFAGQNGKIARAAARSAPRRHPLLVRGDFLAHQVEEVVRPRVAEEAEMALQVREGLPEVAV
jgi:hypothetical protein